MNRSNLDGASTGDNKAIELNPNYAEAYNNRGVTKAGKGDLKGILADYDRAINLKPNFFATYVNRGSVKSRMGDTEGARSDFYEAIELNPVARKTIHELGYSMTGTLLK